MKVPGHICQKALSLQGEEPLAAFFYDLAALRAQARRLKLALPPRYEMFYAIKANSALPILEQLAPLLDGFEVASGGELQWVRQHFPEVPMAFGGPGKTPAELRAAQGVGALHVESLYELEQLRSLERVPPVLLRVNPAFEHSEDSPMLMAGKPSPFGLSPQDLEVALGRLQGLDWLGFHLHTRSLQLSVPDHLQLLGLYFHWAQEWSQRAGQPLRQVNVGGGIGVNYRHPEQQFDWESFCAQLPEQDYRVRFECGRFVSGFCGYYGVEVLDIKANHGEHFAVCRGGTHHFRLPVAQGHSHPFQVVAGRRRGGPVLRQAAVNLVGQLCTPKDRLATQAWVEELAVGDLVIFPLAGAYAWNISHHDFLMHPHPQQVYLDD